MRETAQKLRPPLPWQERAVLTLAVLELAWLTWALGGQRVWAQVPAFVLSLVVFAVALWPRRSPEGGGQAEGAAASGWVRLKGFPLFWIGLLLLACITTSALNPSWQRMSDGKVWWMRRIPSVGWLPTSVDTPFAIMSVWRMLMIYATAWLTGSALWAGLTRRRSLRVLIWLLLCNTVLLCIAGFSRYVMGDHRILWLVSVPGAYGFASFVYHNHAAAYLGLMTLIAVGFTLFQRDESARRFERSSPAILLPLLVVMFVAAIACTTSRAGTGLIVGYLILAVLFYWLFLKPRADRWGTTPAGVKIALFLVVAGCGGYLVSHVDFTALTHRFEALQEQGAMEESYRSRILMREQCLRMLGDHWMRGTGAGSFRFLAPIYLQAAPEIFKGGNMYWEHAHIDWLEIPIELGLTGVLLLATAFGWIVWRWWQLRGWQHPMGLMLMLGAWQTLTHALIDFPFNNGAIIVTWWALLVIMLRWLEFDMAGVEAAPKTAAERYFKPQPDKLR